MRKFSAGPLVLNGSLGFALTDLHNRSFEPELEMLELTAAAQAVTSMAAILSGNPMESFTTGQVGTLLAKINPILGIGWPITNLTGADMYWVQHDPNGDRLAGSNHVKCSIAAGRLILKSIGCDQGKNASAEFDINALYDGSNLPYAMTPSQALPSLTYPINEQYSLGPVKINNAELTDCQGWKYEVNGNTEKTAGGGTTTATMMSFLNATPKLTVNGLDTQYLASVSATGMKQDGTTTTLYLRKMDKHGVRIADGTAAHIRITVSANQGMITPGGWSGTPTTSASGTIIITPTLGASPILTFETGVAIT